MAPTPILLPRPRTLQLAPDGVEGGLKPQGFRIEVAEDVVRVVGADEAGLRHGRATLTQLRHRANAPEAGPDGTLPACRIEDWPDFAVRGVMVDVSRDRVPTLPTLFDLVDRLAGWKINQLQLYMEHTFAYAGHEDVWRRADPYTAADIHALDAHCRSRGVELVANQNTLGHYERWLRLERYRPLAIAPDGFDWIFGIRRPALTLDPANPQAFALVSDLLGQLVPQMASSRVHIGLDEPWELSSDRRGEWVQWLRALRELPVLAGRAPHRASRRRDGVRVGIRGEPSLRAARPTTRRRRSAVLGVPRHVQLDVDLGTRRQHDREHRCGRDGGCQPWSGRAPRHRLG